MGLCVTIHPHPQEGLPNVQECVSLLVKGVDVDGNSTIDYNVRPTAPHSSHPILTHPRFHPMSDPTHTHMPSLHHTRRRNRSS